MKTQRRRGRVNHVPSPASESVDGYLNGDGEGILPEAEIAADQTEYRVPSTESKGLHSQLATHNSVLVEASSQVVIPNLPKRRQRRDTLLNTTSPLDTQTEPAPGYAIRTTAHETSAPAPAQSGGGWRLLITYENLFWLGIFALALATRFWDIGNRGIHHDESLHSVYSRNLYIGGGYVHDPMMHGPLQFHLIALMYWLFGVSESTVRFASAFCGVWVVMSPFFLRRQMGRIPALIAGTLLLVSPSVLYFSRMAREDSIFSATEMLMIVGLLRFITTRKPGDFYIFCAGLSLMFTIKETSYLTVAVLGILFAGLFAYQAGYAILGALGGYAAAMGGFILFINNGMKNGSITKLPDIPSQGPSYEMISDFATRLITHPLFYGGVIITLIFIGVLVALFRMERNRMLAPGVPTVRSRPMTAKGSLPNRRVRVSNGVVVAPANGHATEVAETPDEDTVVSTVTPSVVGPEEASEVWDPRSLEPKRGGLLSHYEPGSLPYLVGGLFSRPVVLLIGFLIAAAIFVTLYTVFFTDTPRGIASGLFASLGYWMAQQGVARGGQPWYYYILLIPLYEPVAVFFSLAATIFFSWRGVRWLLRHRQETRYSGEAHLGAFNIDRPVPFANFKAFLPLFLMWWTFGVFALYSWAGEKMPWLMIHMVRPAILLASLFLGALVVSIVTRRRERLAGAGMSVAGAASDDSANGNGRTAPRRRMSPQGAMFSNLVERTGLAPRKLAYETGMPSNMASNMAFSMNGGGRAATLPARGRAARQAPVRREQEPLWVTWNQPGSVFPFASFLIGFLLLAMAWGVSLTYQMNAAVSNPNAYNTSWAATWIYPGLMVALVIAYAVWLGVGRALRYLAVGLLSLMLLYQFRSAVVLTYNQPDVPKEMAVFVQTSPDVTRAVKELNDFSVATTGGKNIKVMYDSFTSWPMEWYLRDYKNKIFIGGGDAKPGPDVPVLFLEYAKHSNDQALLKDYVAQRYAMRWWFPEAWYKEDLLPGQDPKTSPATSQVGGLLKALGVTSFQPQYEASIWKYLMFREPPRELGSEDMIMFVRKDVAQQLHYLQYLPPNTTDLP